MTTLPADELVERLSKRAAECSSASCHDDKDRFLNVVAKLTRSDGRLMAEAAAELSSLRAKLAEAMEALEGAEAFIEQNYEPAYDSDLLKEVRRARRLVEEGNHG